jgi:hypothetical protein
VVEDLSARYEEYLERFSERVGDVKTGAFAKFDGKLIKKLSFDDFTPMYVEYQEIAARYEEALERGDTINDIVLKLLRERCAHLVLTSPV